MATLRNNGSETQCPECGAWYANERGLDCDSKSELCHACEFAERYEATNLRLQDEAARDEFYNGRK